MSGVKRPAKCFFIKVHRSDRTDQPRLALHCHRHSVAATETKRCNALMHVASDHLVDQSHEYPGATCADRMSESHGAPIDIYLVHVEAELAADAQCLNGERLVELVKIN